MRKTAVTSGPVLMWSFGAALKASTGHWGRLYQTSRMKRRTLCGKELPAEEIERLLELGKTGLIEGFVSKRGSNFGAYLTLSKDKKKAEFEFPPR